MTPASLELTLQPLGTTQVPADLTDPLAVACLARRGLEMIDEAGLWESLPEAARSLFSAALMPRLGSAARQIGDLVQERDDERVISNMLLSALKERDATIKFLRAKLLTQQRAQGTP